MTTATKPSGAIDHETPTVAGTTVEDLTQRARDAAGTVAGAAQDISARIPGAASRVDRIVRSGSDDSLRLVTAAAIGFAIGLLVGGTNRLVVLAALAPAGMIGLVLAGRRSV